MRAAGSVFVLFCFFCESLCPAVIAEEQREKERSGRQRGRNAMVCTLYALILHPTIITIIITQELDSVAERDFYFKAFTSFTLM